MIAVFEAGRPALFVWGRTRVAAAQLEELCQQKRVKKERAGEK